MKTTKTPEKPVLTVLMDKIAAYKEVNCRNPVVVLLSSRALFRLRREFDLDSTAVVVKPESRPKHSRVFGIPLEIIVAHDAASIVKVY